MSIEQYRSQGSSHFAKQRLYEAANAYEAALWYFPDAVEASVITLNAAAAYLKIGLPGRAFRHLEACDRSALTSVQLQKLGFRKLAALYDIGRYEAAEDLWHRMEDYDDPHISEIRGKIRARLQETNAGTTTYDWPAIYRTAKVDGSVETAEWSWPVETRLVEGKGRGLFARKDIAAGGLLLLSPPMAITRPTEVANNTLVGINLASRSVDAPSQVQIVGWLIERATDDSQFAKKLQSMYAGPDFPMPDLPGEAGANVAIDAGRIEGIVSCNSFKPESCTIDMLDDEETDTLLSPTGLYHLPSMINHSCLGNAGYVFFGDLLVVRASEAISSGDEVLFS